MGRKFAEQLVEDLKAPKMELKSKEDNLKKKGVSIKTLKQLNIRQIKKLSNQL